MTDAQILALARVFDQEWTESKGRKALSQDCNAFANGQADMWACLHSAIAQEIKNMHGKRGELLFKNYAGGASSVRRVTTDQV